MLLDGLLKFAGIEAQASLKSYRPKDEEDPPGGGGRNPDVDFHGEKHRRDTHESKTDKDALRFGKSQGTAAKLACLGYPPIINHSMSKNHLIIFLAMKPSIPKASTKNSMKVPK